MTVLLVDAAADTAWLRFGAGALFGANRRIWPATSSLARASARITCVHATGARRGGSCWSTRPGCWVANIAGAGTGAGAGAGLGLWPGPAGVGGAATTRGRSGRREKGDRRERSHFPPMIRLSWRHSLNESEGATYGSLTVLLQEDRRKKHRMQGEEEPFQALCSALCCGRVGQLIFSM